MLSLTRLEKLLTVSQNTAKTNSGIAPPQKPIQAEPLAIRPLLWDN